MKVISLEIRLATVELVALYGDVEVARCVPRRESRPGGVMLFGDWPVGTVLDCIAVADRPGGLALARFPVGRVFTAGRGDEAGVDVKGAGDLITLTLDPMGE